MGVSLPTNIINIRSNFTAPATWVADKDPELWIFFRDELTKCLELLSNQANQHSNYIGAEIRLSITTITWQRIHSLLVCLFRL